MVFPNFKGKHAHDSMINPEEFMLYKKRVGKYPEFKIPEGVIFCYDRSLMKRVLENHKVRKVEGFHADIFLLEETKGRVAIVGNFGIGAPAVVQLFEVLIAFGVKKFLSIGIAGTLQKELKIGDLIVCERAIRDEGTSYHYLSASKYSYASKEITAKIKKSLEKLGEKFIVGTSWTIDAPYRETIAEARHYQNEGVATVEMEASALFAVAKFRDVKIGAIFSISDSLAELEWKPKFHLRKTREGIDNIYRAAVDVLM